ncbi:hypothetical protein TSOC_012791 [Tetrabaena socialis]|uniref:Uncharacterized protein n=1 Tax=Tetrabaena socialis TaxID=47790 RepID=A0A2J7ZM41_9CHLO|nr:hypothetical protein TSOC_012791 [Tetrabaena socialis]|eukprot:PNH01332.1 hypothetical protein TSOC_012791 [Tetrabaena socialis]
MPSKQGARLFWRLSNLRHPNADLEQNVKDHLLNHAIQVLLPYEVMDRDLQDELDIQLVTLLPPDEGYQVIRASLADILAQVLNTAIILQEGASLQAVSLAERLESNHSAAITPDGVLHMAVSSEVYARLGITGARSPSNKDRYNLSLDLKAKSLQPGQERYAQVLAKVRSCIAPQAYLARLEVNGQLQDIGLPREAITPSYGTEAWMPLHSEGRTQPGLLLPPLSRATFQRLGVGMEPGAPAPQPAGPQEPAPGGAPAPQPSIPQGPASGGAPAVPPGALQGPATGGAPALPPGTLQGPAPGGAPQGDAAAAGGQAAGRPQVRSSSAAPRSAQQEWELRRAITGLHTWLGALACGLGHTTCNDMLPDEVMPPQSDDAPLRTPEEEERRILGTMVSRMWKGMLTQRQVQDVMAAASHLAASGRVPWAAVQVWGFADTPVAWRGLEHGAAWGGAGESGYTVVLMREGDYCIFRPLGPNEAPA